MNVREKIMDFMREAAYKPMDLYQLCQLFGISRDEMQTMKKILKSMEKEGIIIKNRAGKYGLTDRMGLIKGKFQGHQKGYGFVIPYEDSPDIFIPANNVNGAMNGDIVIAKILKENEEKKKAEGEIVRILERANKTIVGVYEDSRNFGFVVADDKRIYHDIFIPKAEKNGAKTGDVVIVEITMWPEARRNPEGRIVEILGKKGEAGVDILSIIKNYKLPEEFPEKVLNYAESIPDEIPESEYKRRRDLRSLRMITIDGEDAKDLDDAVSIEKLDNGNFRLGVHIADVSHYVTERSPLDKEALKRGTSVYLIDRVIPMLPKKLSNGICSLNPKVDRLALSCFMEIDHRGKVLNHEIVESVIKTSERMTYTDVTKILRDKDEELIKRYDYLVDDFKKMEELCNILNRKRMNRGAVDFDFAESKIILDEKGKPIDVKPYERSIANRIIEEFMLVCNETVAEHMFWANIPFVYRVHEDPKEEKLEHFYEFIHNLGYTVKRTKELHPRNLQEILEKAKGKKEETVVSTLLLRSMMQARYSPESLGHFGLAARYYCHFTSPIRRYPDLIIHRIIKEFINGKITEERIKKLTSAVEYASIQSSEMERIAQDAEREVDDLKKAEYMLDRIGEEFEGIISSVTSFGFFVELPNTIEGLVHISNLHDDYYFYDEKHLCLIGERTKKMYRLGDEVKVKVSKVDIDNREIHFELTESEDEEENQVVNLEVPKEKLESLSEGYQILSVEEFEKEFEVIEDDFNFKEDVEDEADEEVERVELEEVDEYKEDFSQYLDE
ncbi:MAG: ribonuclease R [Clostridiales bacterium]|uniref:ribonuclease R n=1 Tax=Clostridium sp. N3C TaxID=1776758 RepID=UPI00092DEFEC|nr:ribonuclease R [Clostridium sp. N3C]NLZ49038.1 ribonuclease R [Clostridiales bacterium]SCN22648.1 Ribonuclease R [Clostridium sp. N3C]